MRPGTSRLAIAFLGITGFGAGVLSTRKACVDRLLALDNSPLADLVRKSQGLEPRAAAREGDESQHQWREQDKQQYSWQQEQRQRQPEQDQAQHHHWRQQDEGQSTSATSLPPLPPPPSPRHWDAHDRSTRTRGPLPAVAPEDVPYAFPPERVTDDGSSSLPSAQRGATYQELRERHRSKPQEPEQKKDRT